MATREDIEKLKKSWLKDPCWDIEDTEGFEEHRDELIAFHKEQDAEWEKKKLEREIARGDKVGHWMKIWDIDLAQLVIAREQVRATMLLMAQVKRIADFLGDKKVD